MPESLNNGGSLAAADVRLMLVILGVMYLLKKQSYIFMYNTDGGE
jgi:hypothetical protein